MKFSRILAMSAAIMFLAFGIMAFLASQAEGAETTIDWSKDTVIPVVGEVDSQLIGQAGFIENLINEDKPDKVIKIFINSPGGSVIAGNIFIQSMEVAKARGFRIKCAVSNIAASMAMHILTHCNERYVLKGGYLLFHEARVQVGGIMTSREMRRMAQSMDVMTYTLEEYMVDQLGCTPSFYREHNEGETMWTAETFQQNFPKFKLQLIRDLKVPKTVQQGVFKPINDKAPPPSKGKVGSPAQIPWGVK